MKKCLKYVLLAVLAGIVPGWGQNLSAQHLLKGGNDQFEWRLCGRAFFDGGVFFNDTTGLGNSFQVNDIRLGARISFLRNWEMKMELGYGESKVRLKDIYLGYSEGRHSFRAGYQFEPFGNARVGSANMRLVKNAVSDKTFGDKRKLGLSYSYNSNAFHFMGGIFSQGDIEKSKSTEEGYALTAKFIGRPVLEKGRVVHIGFAPRFCSASDEVRFSGGIPTDLLAGKDNTWLEAQVDQVINQWKMDVELILICNKWYFQGQYYRADVNRRGNAGNYRASGWYAQAGYLILGDRHNYKAATGMVVNPAPGSLEFLCRYDATDLNDGPVRGGCLSDFSAGLNWFINRYVAARMDYTYMMPGESSPMGGKDFSCLQGRLQFSF